MALVVLIIIMPVFYSNIQDDIKVDVVEMELKEIADYVSNTFSNTYFLLNSSDISNINITKRLVYLPTEVESYTFGINFEENESNVVGVTTYLIDRPYVNATAWISPGLKVGEIDAIESGRGIVEAGCYKSGNEVFLLLKYESGGSP